MKRESKTESSLFYEKRLYSFYLKHRILSIKFILCIMLSFLLLFDIFNALNFEPVTSQIISVETLYRREFIVLPIFFSWFRVLPVIIAADIVSGEFSNKSAMIIYATESRNKILAIKLLCVVISIFILMVFYFSTFLILIFIRTNLFVSIPIFLMGFLIIFVQLLFYLSLTFMISALTQNTTLSFILPFFYIIIETFLEDLELELLSYSSYLVNVVSFFENLIFNEQIIFSSVTVICIIIFFGLPILVMLITFYAFKQLDIRVN